MGSTGPEQLRTVIRDDANGEVAITVTGEIDLSTAEQFRLDVLGADLAGRRVVFDLAGVTFLDSSGLAVLLEAAGRVASIVLHDPSPIVRRVIEATGLEASFTMRP